MSSFVRHQHKESSEVQAGLTQGHILNWGWRYDLMLWFSNLMTRGKWRVLQRKIIDLARFQPGESVLDVGCGTGDFSLDVYTRVGAGGRVSGIDPGPKQIARARVKAARRGSPIDFQIGVVEQIVFPDQSFDVVLSTFMMHMLPDDLKRQGLREIARVLKPGGRLLVVDTRRPEEPAAKGERIVHTGPWNSGIQDQPQLLKDAGFSQIESGEVEIGATRLPRIGFVLGRKSLV